jgi:hypothetical protein
MTALLTRHAVPPRRGRARTTTGLGGLVVAVVGGGLLVFGLGNDPEPATATTSPTASTPTASTPTVLTPTTSGPTTSPGAAPPPAVSAAAEPGSALAVLATIPVKGRAPTTGYDRDLFGQRWADTDRNGCDTRNDVLRRDMTGVQLEPGTHDCVVLSGLLAEPYSGRSVSFLRGQDSSELVQIDHVVALSDAWQKGAQQWTAQRRLAFANDPLNLLAVDGALNSQKGDGDAATWLPPSTSYRCAYVARQVAVKAKYGAWVTAAERDAIARVLSRCPGEPLPSSDAPVEATAPAAAPAPVPAPATTPDPVQMPAASSCDPAYPGVCIPPPSQAGDLDCGDITHRRFVVLPPDPHRFDGSDDDGIGCES